MAHKRQAPVVQSDAVQSDAVQSDASAKRLRTAEPSPVSASPCLPGYMEQMDTDTSVQQGTPWGASCEDTPGVDELAARLVESAISAAISELETGTLSVPDTTADLGPSDAPLTIASSSAILAGFDLTHMPDHPQVYPPCHGTALLIAALTAEAPMLRTRKTFIDVGCGCGVVAAHAAQLMPSAAVFASDINPDALRATLVTGARNHALVHVIRMDLLDSLRPSSVDVAAFHVPHVPTSKVQFEDAATNADFSAAWAGGPRGLGVINRLLPMLRRSRSL